MRRRARHWAAIWDASFTWRGDAPLADIVVQLPAPPTVEEIRRAVNSLRSVSWDSIHADRFSFTPYELYQEIVRSAEVRIARHDAEAERRQARLGVGLAEDGTEAAEEQEEGADVGEDEDSDFAEAEVDLGSNYARILPPQRKGDFQVFRAVIEGYRRKPNLRSQLPLHLRAVLRKPSDEMS